MGLLLHFILRTKLITTARILVKFIFLQSGSKISRTDRHASYSTLALIYVDTSTRDYGHRPLKPPYIIEPPMGVPDAHLSFILSKWFESSSVCLLTFWQCEWAEMGVGVVSPSAREIVTAARADVGNLCSG